MLTLPIKQHTDIFKIIVACYSHFIYINKYGILSLEKNTILAENVNSLQKPYVLRSTGYHAVHGVDMISI